MISYYGDHMKNKCCVYDSVTFRSALEQLDRCGFGIIIVLDKDERMIGLLTDGDVRRALLKGVQFDVLITDVMNTNFDYVHEAETNEARINRMKSTHIRHLPVLGSNRKLIDLILLDDIEFKRNETLVVLMVGGMGTRLGELTRDCPKPMLMIDGKPLLERIILEFISSKYYRFVLCVNYLSDQIIGYFGDGEKWGVEIKYTVEDRPLGTAGALHLLPERPREPFIVMNGDLLTNFDFTHMVNYHKEHNSDITSAVTPYNVTLPYGVIEHDHGAINQVIEKPTYTYHTCAGIYVLSPVSLECFPSDVYYDMPSLINSVVEKGYSAHIFPLHEKWLDIGRPEDLEKARAQ